MSVWARARARLRGFFRRDAVAGEIREELEIHLRMRAEGYQRAGTPAPVALRRARARVGNLALWQDRGYDIRGGGVMETIWQDVRYGLRLLRRQPGFSLIAIFTLALGIGATTAIASVIDAAMLHPLPHPRPHELIYLNVEMPRPGRPGNPARYAPSKADLQAIRAMPSPPAAVSMWRTIRPPIADGSEPERVDALEIDEYFLGLFEVAPIRGRGIQAHDTNEGAPPVVMLGYGYWQRRFGGRDDAIGQRLQLDDVSAEIIGVAPVNFYGTTEIWLPLRVPAKMTAARGSGGAIYGRLKTGVTIEQAERQLTEVLARVESLGPPPPPGWQIRIGTLLARNTTGYWTTANILLAAVGLILLIACVNVAGLLLARGATRMHEVAIRTSIGAGRGRLVRQLLTESLLLGLTGGALGVIAAWWTLDALVANIPLPVSSNAPAAVNGRILAFSLAVSIVTGLVFGLAPALRLSRVRLTGVLARASRRTGAALSRRGGQWLIGVEIALALVLITGAGLMIRSFGRLVNVDLGFQPDSYLTVQATPTDLQPAVFSRYYTSLVDAIRQMPDVEAAGAINHPPLMGSMRFTSISLDDGRSEAITLRQVLPGYFEAIGLRPVTGRFPGQEDLTSGPAAVVLGQRTARRLFPDGTAVGRTLTVLKEPAVIVGIAPDLKVSGAEPYPGGDPFEVFHLYRPAAGERPDALVVVVRPREGARDLPARLRQAALQVGPRVVLERVRHGSDWLDDTVLTPKRRTVLLALLGGLGLLLTLVGVFGMTAYAVARRTREIGVRIAFGAGPRDVVRAMFSDATRPVLLGIVAGLAGSWFATRAISTFLYETTPTDAVTFAAAAVVLALTAFVAVWIPARRASRVDAVQALRTE